MKERERKRDNHLLLNRTVEFDVNRAVSLRARLRKNEKRKGGEEEEFRVSENLWRGGSRERKRRVDRNSPASPLPLNLPLFDILHRQLDQHRCKILLFLEPSPNPHQLPRTRSATPSMNVPPSSSDESHLDRVLLVLE